MTGKVLTRPGETRTTFDSGDAYIERIEAAVAIFKSKNLDPERPVPEQMNETAEQGTGRVRNPVYHYVISWQKKSVTHHEAHKAVARTVEALGARGWQWVGALHGDTDNPHCHVIINRIHPETGLAWRSSHDHYKLAKICREIEPQRVRREVVDLPSPRAADYEVYTGQLSMQSWARQTVMPTVAERVLASRNRSWDALHQALATHGISYEANGTLVEQTGTTPTTTKANGVSATISLPYLEKRLGQYQTRKDSIELAVEGYGSARERYELTTPRMRKPDLAPFYATWVSARNNWTSGGRERASMDRVAVRKHAQRAERDVLSDLAQSQEILQASVPELADQLWKRLLEIAGDRIQAIKRTCANELADIAKSKPHELFRTWLKNLAKNGDAKAAQAVTALRQGEDMEYSSKSIDGRAGMRPDTYATYVIDAATAARRLIEARDDVAPDGTRATLETRLNVAWNEFGPEGTAGQPDLETMMQRVERQSVDVVAVLTSVERAEYELVRDDILKTMNPTTSKDSIAQQVATAAALVPFAVRAESSNKIDGRTARALWAPMRDQDSSIDVDFAHAITGNAPACRHASTIWNDAIASGLQPDAIMPDNYVPIHLQGTEAAEQTTRERVDALSDDEAHEMGVDNGTIQKARVPLQYDPNERTYRERYELFLENFAAVGFGARAQEAQQALAMERYRRIEIARTIAVKDIPEKNWMDRAEVDVKVARFKANTARTARMEADVVRLVTGAVPPPSFHEYLKSLDDEQAKHLAGRIRHREDSDAARYHSIGVEAALLVTMRRTKNGMTYSLHDKPRFHDDGEMIHIDSTRDPQACDAALLVASERFGDALQLEGKKPYKSRMLRRAVELGIYIGNPELQIEQTRLIEERDKARKTVEQKIPSEFANRYAESVRNPNVPPHERRQNRNAIMEEAVIATFESEYGIKVAVTKHDEIGTFEDVLIFQQNAYALLRDRDNTYVVVPLNAGYAREISELQTARAEVAVTPPSPETGLSELQIVPNEAQIEAQQRKIQIDMEDERETAMAGQRTRGGR